MYYPTKKDQEIFQRALRRAVKRKGVTIMTDRIQLTKDYTYMNLDGQWQVVLSGSIVDVPSASAWPSATVVSKGVTTTIPSNYHGVSAGSVKVR